MLSRNIRLLCLISAGICCAAPVAQACGPDFSMLLYNRQDVLFSPIGCEFAMDATTFAARPSFKFNVGTGSARYPYDPALARAEIELRDLSPPQQEALRAMRQAPDGDTAFALGSALPPAIRLYTAAAVDFHRGRDDAPAEASENPSTEENAAAAANLRRMARQRAEQRFREVLALPEEDARERAVWAAFMLGRTLRADDRRQEAAASFQHTRALAMNGLPDPLALAEASLGEEAGIFFATGHFASAAALYADQAAQGAEGGVASLRMVAKRLLADRETLRAHIADPLLQRLLVSYVLSLYENNRVTVASRWDRPQLETPPSQAMFALIDAAEASGSEHLVQADRLAALAYDAARYDLAARFVNQAEGPLAAWVGAKLAMRRGDTTAAAQHYAEAARAFPQLGEGLGNNPRQPRLVLAERAILLLARTDYLQALAQFYAVGKEYWPDLAFVAERVVTVDELKDFVDRQVAKPPLPSPPPADNAASAAHDTDDDTWPAARLRDLLARRLVREGRMAEAAPYFHDPGDRRFGVSSWRQGRPHFSIPDAGAETEAYSQALQSAGKAWNPIERARALFAAARIARSAGMSIMGYELAPDYFMHDGAFAFLEAAPETQDRMLIGSDETERFRASAANPEKRFHYRYRATDLAIQAAEALPHRSQAYAAILCQATGWLLDRDPSGAQEIYLRYVRNGPRVRWAADFGRNCPEPDYDRAAGMMVRETLAPLVPPLRHP